MSLTPKEKFAAFVKIFSLSESYLFGTFGAWFLTSVGKQAKEKFMLDEFSRQIPLILFGIFIVSALSLSYWNLRDARKKSSTLSPQGNVASPAAAETNLMMPASEITAFISKEKKSCCSKIPRPKVSALEANAVAFGCTIAWALLLAYADYQMDYAGSALAESVPNIAPHFFGALTCKSVSHVYLALARWSEKKEPSTSRFVSFLDSTQNNIAFVTLPVALSGIICSVYCAAYYQNASIAGPHLFSIAAVLIGIENGLIPLIKKLVIPAANKVSSCCRPAPQALISQW